MIDSNDVTLYDACIDAMDMIDTGRILDASSPRPRGVQWAVPPGLARGPAHYIVVSCRAGPVTVVGRAGTTRVSGPCRA